MILGHSVVEIDHYFQQLYLLVKENEEKGDNERDISIDDEKKTKCE